MSEWVQVGGGSILKWSEPGQTVEGRWAGQRDGQYGPLGMIDTEEGRVSVPLQTALVDKVANLEDGDEVKIVFVGWKKGKKSGKDFKDFAVYTKQHDARPLQPDNPL